MCINLTALAWLLAYLTAWGFTTAAALILAAGLLRELLAALRGDAP
jgi:hypothetical protein